LIERRDRILLKKTKLLFFAFFLLSGVFALFARDIEIIVLDQDLFIPLEGAVIRSWDGSEHICDLDGKVVIQVPDNRPVVIQAAYPGYETARIVIPTASDSVTVNLRLLGIMEGRELVVEATRPGIGETQTGRSIAVTGREITQTAEIGIIEDVMSSIKLLPGVGYTGIFNAMPSIRGGDPGDLRASLDGFYVFHPYHWGGGFSIFSPRMVESAQLSHGVFSSRHGHTISGLLDIRSRKPHPAETEFQLGVSTSAASFGLSLPFSGRGGILLMGNITYYDPVVAFAKLLADLTGMEELEAVHSIQTAPYIRSATITGNYRFTDNLELYGTGFFGMDGIGINFQGSIDMGLPDSESDMDFTWTNYNTFFTSSLAWNPRNNMLLKLTGGVGYWNSINHGFMTNTIYQRTFSASANDWLYTLRGGGIQVAEPYDLDTSFSSDDSHEMLNVQGRIDFDWDLGNGFLLAMGIQELYKWNSSSVNQEISSMDIMFGTLDPGTQQTLFHMMNVSDPVFQNWMLNNMYVSFPLALSFPRRENQTFTTSAYGLVEHATPNNRLNTELGLRVDHFYSITNRDFSLQSRPALNPRFNTEYNVFNNQWIIQSLNLTAGTGLFSSINNVILLAGNQFNLTEIKPDRSWTSVVGSRIELNGGFIFNIEGYYKTVFDRAYFPINYGIDGSEMVFQFDGEGRVWGLDFKLQRRQSRLWDGWLSYSFNWTKYRNPNAGMMDGGYFETNIANDWFFPDFHRFHNLNLVLNIKPRPGFNIYTRFGVASGIQIPHLIGDSPMSYPVYIVDQNKIIEKFFWPSERDENNRTGLSFQMDLKFSIFGSHRSGKSRFEVYFALENVLAFVNPKGNPIYNQFTGEVYTGIGSTYELPIPIPSFGVKFSF
jgi:hypothetical protein